MVDKRRALLFWAIPAMLVLFLFGCAKTHSAIGNKSAVGSGETGEKRPAETSGGAKSSTSSSTVSHRRKKAVVLYFSDSHAEKLIKEVREATETAAPARAALEELIKGPKDSSAAPTIPKGTKLLGVSIKNSTAEVDFSKEFIDNHPGGTAGEQMTVYSVVDTLTEFSTVSSVRFLVEGEPIDTIAGHMDLSQPVERDESFL